MKPLHALIGFFSLVFATSALAQMPTTEPKNIKNGTYAIEPLHTQIVFSINHFGYTNYYGIFTSPSGELTYDSANIANSKVEITIPIANINTLNAKLDGELKGPMWFDAEKFPTATFKSTSIETTGPDTGKITGDLTLHGVTKAVTLTAKLHGVGRNPMTQKLQVGFDATATINRGDFKVSQFSPMLGDEVQLMISANFEKQPAK